MSGRMGAVVRWCRARHCVQAGAHTGLGARPPYPRCGKLPDSHSEHQIANAHMSLETSTRERLVNWSSSLTPGSRLRSSPSGPRPCGLPQPLPARSFLPSRPQLFAAAGAGRRQAPGALFSARADLALFLSHSARERRSQGCVTYVKPFLAAGCPDGDLGVQNVLAARAVNLRPDDAIPISAAPLRPDPDPAPTRASSHPVVPRPESGAWGSLPAGNRWKLGCFAGPERGVCAGQNVQRTTW